MHDKIVKPIGRRTGHFVWRNHELLRIEAFSDAVIAFAVTLTIVSLEVPQTFHELLNGMRGMIGFGICFTFLFMIWYKQYLFFRYFGLRDITTIVLNAMLLFVILFYVYPLKFLFSFLAGGGNQVEHNGEIINRIASGAEMQQLMVVYSGGFMAVYLMLFLLFQHAWRKRKELHLSEVELFNVKTEMLQNIVMMSIAFLSIVVALLLPNEMSGMAGMIYILVGPSVSIFHSIRIRMLKTRVSAELLEEHAIAVEKSRKGKLTIF
ncbi:MAG: TMEM175 family protein [Bacteroidota bacterium]